MKCLINLVNGEGELVHLVVGRQLYRVPWHTRPKLQLSFTQPANDKKQKREEPVSNKGERKSIILSDTTTRKKGERKKRGVGKN
jgi:hypothetical protein